MGGLQGFVDESERKGHPGVYVVALVLVDPRQLSRVRKAARSLRLPGQRELHFVREKPQRQRLLADQIARMPVTSRIYHALVPTPKEAEAARQACLQALALDLVALGVRRVVFDSRDEQRDRKDNHTIYQALQQHPDSCDVTFDHRPSFSEECLHIADGVAWCWGARPEFRHRISDIITSETSC